MAGNAVAAVLSDRLDAERCCCARARCSYVGVAGVAGDDASRLSWPRVSSAGSPSARRLIAPVYIAEIAPARRRGSSVSLNQLMIVIGISASFFSNYFLLGVGEHNWRWMLGVQVFPALLYLLLLSLIPESPRWLVIKGRDDRHWRS